MQEPCIWLVCFYRMSGTEPRFFGFAEFLAGLALMVLAWTIADVRYRFRVKTAPLPLQGLTFGVVGAVGLLSLLTDVWRAQQWFIPKGELLSPATWQGLLGGIFFATFLVWAWFAFLRPPTYGTLNSKRFGDALYGAVLRGQSTELAIVADELFDSIAALVKRAPTKSEVVAFNEVVKGGGKVPLVNGYAQDIFRLFGDPRLARALVNSAPHTALELFKQMASTGRCPASLRTFATNFVEAAVQNKESFVYHEAEDYRSGLLGDIKPLTTAMFAKYDMVDHLDGMLDVSYDVKRRWDAEQLEAYCRLVILALQAFVKDGDLRSHPAMFYRAFGTISGATFDIYKLDKTDSISVDNDALNRMSAAVKFVVKAVEVLDSAPVPPVFKVRHRKRGGAQPNVYDALARTTYELIWHASWVQGPIDTCWWVQHNAVWGELFHFNNLSGPSGAVIKHKVRRMIYDDIIELSRFPSPKGARLLGLCLNVLGHRVPPRSYDRDSRALKESAVGWVKRNYSSLYATRPDIAEQCLVDGMSYDPTRRRILFAHKGPMGHGKLRYTFLQVD